MTITLPCRHVFTVKTLDNIAHISEFYEKSHYGQWIKPVTLAVTRESCTRLACPICGVNIDSLRYGRICKSLNMSTVQHNIALNLSCCLTEVRTKLAPICGGLNNAVSDAVKTFMLVNTPSDLTKEARRKITKKLDTTLVKEVNRPTPPEVLENPDSFHTFPVQALLSGNKPLPLFWRRIDQHDKLRRSKTLLSNPTKHRSLSFLPRGIDPATHWLPQRHFRGIEADHQAPCLCMYWLTPSSRESSICCRGLLGQQ